jgi:GH18 family chitinase
MEGGDARGAVGDSSARDDAGRDAGEGGAADAGPAPSPTRLVGYLLDSTGSFAGFATSIDFARMTQVNLAFASLPLCNGSCTAQSDMTPSLGQSDADIATFVTAAHAAGVKVAISVGEGPGDANVSQFYNAGLSDALVTSLDSYLVAHNLDGIDVDVEDPNNMGAPYADFVSALVAHLRPKGIVITAAVAEYLQSAMPDSALSQFDYVNDMFYSSDVNGAKAELDFYVQKGVPADRITLGVPFFGNGNGDPTYAQILSQYPDAWQADSVGGITYVGEATMAAETGLGKQYGGVMIWQLAGDAPPPHSLLDVIRNNL